MTRPTANFIRLTLCCALSLVFLGCDDASNTSSDEPSNWDTYVVGLEKVGENGVFKVRLLLSDPIPQDTGFYNWTLEVLTVDDAPVVGASVQARPTMPAHGHGTFPPQTLAVEEGVSGNYQLLNLDLFMAGVWRVEINLESSDGLLDQVVFNFDLEG